MVKKNILKLISNALIIIGGLISVITIILIAICIYIIINKSIIINDNNKFISKAISWYYDTSVTFEYIQIGNLNEYKNISIEIYEFKIHNYKNYKVIQAENIKYNINYNSLRRNKYYITNVELLNPIVIYETNSNKYNNTIVKKINKFLVFIEDIVIYNGKVVYSNLEKKYYLSDINISKKGLNDLDVLGNFLYRDNNSYTEDKKFAFKSKKVIDNYKINLNFTELSLPNFILNIYNLNNSYTISGLFSGEAIINIQNNKIINTELKMHSSDSIITLKKNLDYDKFSLVNIPHINKVSLSLFYDFNKSLLRISNLTFDIENKLKIKSEIILSAEKLLNSESYNINYILNNINIKDFIKVHEYKANLFLDNLLTGSGNLALINNSINNFDFVINNFYYEEVFFKNININYDKNSDIANIFLDLDSDHLSFLNFIKKYNFTSQDFSYFKHKNYGNLLNNLSFKMQFPNISQSFDNYIVDIKGNLSIKNVDLFYINKFLYITNINYFVNIDKNKIDLSGSAQVNDVEINFNLIKLDENKININFDLNDQFFINNNLNKKFKGFTSIDCTISSQIKVWFYICDANLTKNIIALPLLGFAKNLGESAYLNFNGIINNELLEDNNFTFKHQDNLFKGNYKFNNIDNSYYINFNKFIFNKNELVLTLLFKNNSIDIDITSGILDLTPFLTIENNTNNNLIPNIKLLANLNKLIIFDNILLGPTKISSTNIYNNLTLKSSYNYSETITFNIKNNNNILSYNFKASNAGHFFNLFDYKTEIKDGVLTSQGFIGELENNNDIMGTFSIDNFKLMKTSLFAELLLAASFTGLFDLLNNEGITFDQLDAQFTKKDNILNINKSRAYGFSLGLTGEGQINNFDKTLDINGSIVPAYKLNTIFNNIPLIGDILSGKEDEGIFAINYTARGEWKNPDIVVNPLSILTPGIIRNIFD